MLCPCHEYCVLLNPYCKNRKEKQDLVSIVSSTWEETLKKQTPTKHHQKKKQRKKTETRILLEGDSSEGADVYKAVLGKQIGIDLPPNSTEKISNLHSLEAPDHAFVTTTKANKQSRKPTVKLYFFHPTEM